MQLCFHFMISGRSVGCVHQFSTFFHHKRHKPFSFIFHIVYTKLFHKLANDGDKIISMRYSKPERRLMSAAKLAMLVKLKEIKKVFYNQKSQ